MNFQHIRRNVGNKGGVGTGAQVVGKHHMQIRPFAVIHYGRVVGGLYIHPVLMGNRIQAFPAFVGGEAFFNKHVFVGVLQ